MKIGNNFSAFNISAAGLSLQRKKMNLIAENIANASTTKTEEGGAYQRKYISASQKKNPLAMEQQPFGQTIKLETTNPDHIKFPGSFEKKVSEPANEIVVKENVDEEQGQVVYMPDHPDADENGYVQMPNVNVITEMVDMITATRGYDANLTALNASKQIAKDSLEI
ncbi:MAG TPA: flagellar basal body rod protein FlgC [Ignavibacteriales bacterium]|nr:flagellar basal body rod protein FlgC [Ignavibacteriales bacterium]